MDAERIKDRAAVILAGMPEGGTRDERAADAVHSALAIERAVVAILAGDQQRVHAPSLAECRECPRSPLGH